MPNREADQPRRGIQFPDFDSSLHAVWTKHGSPRDFVRFSFKFAGWTHFRAVVTLTTRPGCRYNEAPASGPLGRTKRERGIPRIHSTKRQRVVLSVIARSTCEWFRPSSHEAPAS